MLCEMQSVSSRIWTRIAVFISYGDNDYTTGTFTDVGWTQMLDDRCPGLFSPGLTGDMSMWPRSADASSSRFVTRGLGWCFRIWFAATENSGTCYLVMQEQMQQVYCKSGWLLPRHLVISATGVVRGPVVIFRRLSEIALKRAGLWFLEICS